MQQRLELLRKVDPPTIQKQKTQSKLGKTVGEKSMSMSSKLQNTPLDNMNTSLTSDISVILPALDYNIMEDMKKTHANISLFEFAKIQSQQDILLRTVGQTSIEIATSTSKGESTSLGSLTTVLNRPWMEEANYVCPPFFLSFEIFNCNVHNRLVDSGASANVMPLSISKKIISQWSKASAQIIELDLTCIPAFGELRDVIIQLSHDDRVHQCIKIIVVDILEAYGLLLSRDRYSKLNGYFAID